MNNMKKSLKASNGITLIALVITIIVLLILAGISISMLSGDNGILQRATDAKVKTEKAQIIENAQTDILGQQAENKGTNITKKQLVEILNTYFKPTAKTSIPDEISTTNDIELTTIDEKYKINLSQIYKGSFEVEQVKWTYNHDTQTVTNGTVTLNIGDYIKDTENTIEGFNGQWRVLGEESGQLLLVTANYADFSGSVGSEGTPLLSLQGTDSLNTSINKLNNVCEAYSNEDKFKNGRSLTADDINKVTGYSPNNTTLSPSDLSQKGIFGNNTVQQYKNKVTYTLKNNRVWYAGDTASTEETQSYSTNSNFRPICETENIKEPYTIENNYYTYFAETLGYFPSYAVAEGQTMEGLSVDSPAYDMLFKLQSNIPYWLATPMIDTNPGWVDWGLFCVVSSGQVAGNELCSSYDKFNIGGKSKYTTTSALGVRAVVTLNSTIIPKLLSKDDTTNISTYEI